jgi:hypothetical protein
MGMMDWVRSSYNLGEQFTDTELQTKDIEDGIIGGTMTHYWIDPIGRLWCPDYSGTTTFEEIKEDDPRYSKDSLFLNFEFIPTGKRGKYRIYLITKYIVVYPSNWKGKWEDWPRLKLHFVNGALQDYEQVSRQSIN